MRILITGARAPACLEWARLLREAGCAVAAADSVAVPLTRFSNCVERWFRLPEPVRGVNEYGAALLAAAERFHADLILPTCEEAFYIAHQRRRLERQCRVFVADFDLMARLHDKHAFAEFSRDLPIAAPPTVLLQSSEAVMQHARRAGDLVFKPVYSRFAARMLIRPSADALQDIRPTPAEPWIAQEFVPGRELCSYSLLQDGRLLAHAAYHPKYRVGRGGGIYLEPVESEPIRGFVRAFGAQTGYTGQVGFDFIESADGCLSVLECNPRATSGIHLLSRQARELASLLQNSAHENPPTGTIDNELCIAPPKLGAGGRSRRHYRRVEQEPLNANGSARMVAVAMVMFAAPGVRSLSGLWEFARDWRGASDIVGSPKDRGPALAQMLGLGEIYLRAMRSGRAPLAAATQDIEWNGSPLGAQP